jgi:hypothetical protein
MVTPGVEAEPIELGLHCQTKLGERTNMKTLVATLAIAAMGVAAPAAAAD